MHKVGDNKNSANKISPEIYIILTLLNIWIFFLYSMGSNFIQYSIPCLIIIFIFLIKMYIANNLKKRFPISLLIWFFSAVYMVISSVSMLKYGELFRAFRFTLYYILGIFIFVLLTRIKDWYKLFTKTFLIFAAVYALVTLWSAFYTEEYLKLAQKIFIPQQYTVVKSLVVYNGFPGLGGQTGVNAFILAIGIGITYCLYLNAKNTSIKERLIYISLFFLFLIALLLTSKRSLLIFTIITIIIISTLNEQGFKKLKVMILVPIVLGILVLIYRSVTDSLGIINVFDRFKVRNGDITSGRIDLYKEAIRLFKQNPFLGNGIQSYEVLSNIKDSNTGVTLQAHNIYLQLLCEVGLIGVTLFVGAVIANYCRTIKEKNRIVYSKLQKDNRLFLNISLYVQIIFLLYGCLGNPLYDFQMLYTYLIFSAIPYTMTYKNRF